MSTYIYGIPPRAIPGATCEERYAYLMAHLTRNQRRKIVERRLERLTSTTAAAPTNQEEKGK